MSEDISFKVTFGKQTIPFTLPLTTSILDLKHLLESSTGVPINLQKLFLKGPLKNDEVTLQSLNIKPNTKILLVGSTATDISTTASIRPMAEEVKKIDFSRDGFSSDQQRIIERGPAPGCLPGNMQEDQVLPDSIPGLYDHLGTVIRLVIRKDTDELWLVTTSRTKKIPFVSISKIDYVPIIRHPGYGVLTLTLGKSNKFNLYFFPQQFNRNLKILISHFHIEGNIFDD